MRYSDPDSSRQRVTFPDQDGAREFAQRVVRELADKRTSFVTLHGPEAYGCQRAAAQLAPTSLSLADAVRLIADNLQLLSGSASLPDVVRYYVENRPRTSPDITVQEVADRLIQLRQREGEVGALHLRDLRCRLTRFAREFQCPISKVSTAANRNHELGKALVSPLQRRATSLRRGEIGGQQPGDVGVPAVPRPLKNSDDARRHLFATGPKCLP